MTKTNKEVLHIPILRKREQSYFNYGYNIYGTFLALMFFFDGYVSLPMPIIIIFLSLFHLETKIGPISFYLWKKHRAESHFSRSFFSCPLLFITEQPAISLSGPLK